MRRRDASAGGTAVAIDVAPVAAPRDYLVLAALVVATGLSLATVFSSAQTERSPRTDDQAVARIERVDRPVHWVPCSAASGCAPVQEVSIVLRVATDGTIGIAGQQFRDDQLDNLFRAVFAHDKRTQVVLKVELKTRDPGARFTGRASNLFLTHVRHEVDKGVAHRRVVNLMERAKAAGLTRFAIGTSGGT